jgi:hypothetical protein
MLTKNLQLHFSCVGTPVSCRIAKPFLPAQAVTHLAITVTSPITAHLGQCSACKNDLNTIKELNLTDGQYYRFAQLLAEPQNDDYQFSDILSAMDALSHGRIDELSAKQREQICIQKRYRDSLYQNRQTSLSRQIDSAGHPAASSRDLMPSDLFDMVVPYGAEVDGSAASISDRLGRDQLAIERVQRLHETIYGIVDRPDSGVVTVFDFDLENVSEPAAPDDFPDKLPVTIEVSGAQIKPVTAKTESPQISAPTVKRNWKRQLTPWAVAAAVFIVLGVLLNLQPATAVDLSRINNALAKEKNIYVANYVPGTELPVSETWASRLRNINLIKAGAGWSLWDLENKVMKSSTIDFEGVKTRELDAAAYAKAKRHFEDFMVVIPKKGSSSSETEPVWSILAESAAGQEGSEYDIYERKNTSKTSSGALIHLMWRGFVDPKTNLPVRTESYQKMDTQGEYQLVSYATLSYITDTDMQVAIQSVTNSVSKSP